LKENGGRDVMMKRYTPYLTLKKVSSAGDSIFVGVFLTQGLSM
jgi:hypothetical protein